MKLSIIVPVFNEEKTIQTILKQLRQTSLSGFEKEIIVVNDASTDKTLEKIQEETKKDKKILLLSHKKNSGKGVAILSGIKKATGDYILIQDADREYDPVYIPHLLKPLKSKKKIVVYGTRLKRLPNFMKEEKKPLFLLHYFGNRFLSLLVSIFYTTWLTDIETGYKVIPSEFFKTTQLYAQKFEIEAEITVKLLKNGYTIIEVPIKTTPRGYEEGKKLQTIPEGIKAVKMIIKHRFL